MENKTAMQQHIQWLKEVIANCEAQNVSQEIIRAIEYVIEGAKAKLQMEKEQIIDAATWGGLAETGEQYYKEKYGKE